MIANQLMPSRCWWLVYCASLSVLTGCGHEKTSQAAPVVRDSSGTAILESNGVDKPLIAEPKWISDISTPDSSLTVTPWGVAVEPATGRIAVADLHGARVAIFDRSGRFVQQLGTQGDGPGEFRRPSALTLDPSGQFVVWDTGRRILSTWSPDGELLSETAQPLEYWGPGLAFRGDALIAVVNRGDDTRFRQRLVAKHEEKESLIHEVEAGLTTMSLPCGTMPAPPIYSPSIIWASRGNEIYFVNGEGYRIDNVNAAGEWISLRRDIPAITVDERMATEAAANGPGPYRRFMQLCGVDAQSLADAVGHAETVSPIQGLAVDPANRLWAMRTTDGVRPRLADIFSPIGQYEGTMAVPGLAVGFLSPDSVLFLKMSDDGEPVLSLFHVPAFSDIVAVPASSTRGARASRPFVVDAARERPLQDNEFQDCSQCPVMVQIPAGRFLMGAAGREEDPTLNRERPEWTLLAEKPQQEVSIPRAFAIGKFEVTFEQWDACVAAAGCSHEPSDQGFGRDGRPVINVARADAEEYVGWLTSRTGHMYRLPTEAEWEYAARAGTTTARYWGEEIGANNAVCARCGSKWDNESTAPVGSFAPNPFGLYDMLGNAKEWVADCWLADLQGMPTDGSMRWEESKYLSHGSCSRPVYRGGAWSSYSWTLRAATRVYDVQGAETRRSESVGLRVVREISDTTGT